MAKDTYYFSHDYNARNDKKISALVREFKSSGYGIFWATCEMMHEEGGSLEFDELTIDAIARDINEDSALVKNILEQCVDRFKLFTKEELLLQSNRVHRNLITKNEKKAVKAEAGRLGGIKSGESRRNNNSTKQNEAVLQAASSNEPNKSKVKESKGNEIKDILPKINSNLVCYDVEDFILKNQKTLEGICIATSKGIEEAKKELHQYHLWLEKKEKYPMGNKAVTAGFESWLHNKKEYNKKYGSPEEETIKKMVF
jgi:hypothetical protein